MSLNVHELVGKTYETDAEYDALFEEMDASPVMADFRLVCELIEENPMEGFKSVIDMLDANKVPMTKTVRRLYNLIICKGMLASLKVDFKFLCDLQAEYPTQDFAGIIGLLEMDDIPLTDAVRKLGIATGILFA